MNQSTQYALPSEQNARQNRGMLADFFQPELFSLEAIQAPEASQEPIELLDPSSLNTVLEMLALIETADELAMLDVLTEAQKQQVWEVVPATLKAKLQTVRSSDGVALHPVATSSQAAETPLSQSTAAEPELSLTTPPIYPLIPSPDPPLQVGDRVVLKSKPQLSKAELLAIFEVIKIQDTVVQVRSTKIGTRRYQMDWLVLYSRKSEIDNANDE